MSTARDHARAGRNRNTALAKKTRRCLHELRFGVCSPEVTPFLRLDRAPNAPIFPRGRAGNRAKIPARGRRTPQNEIPEFGPTRWTAPNPRLAPFNRRAACPSAVRSQITPIRGRSDLKMRLICDIILLRLGLVFRAISALARCQQKNKRGASHTSLMSMCSRGLRIFFRARNQVSNRKSSYRLTAIILPRLFRRGGQPPS